MANCQNETFRLTPGGFALPCARRKTPLETGKNKCTSTKQPPIPSLSSFGWHPPHTDGFNSVVELGAFCFMKRKKRRAITVVTDDGWVTTERPAMDLPFSHPFRVRQRQLEGNWTRPNHDGVRYMQILDHESAKSMVTNEAPRILDFVKKCQSDTAIAREVYISPCGHFFIIMVAGFMTPDADDPDRVESGWFVTKIGGPIKHLEKYSKLAESVMRKAFE